jgi:hypothetical protein
MTGAALFPTPAAVEASTPAGRDRAIDVIRIVSLIGVVVGHTVVVTSILRNDVFYWSNLLTASPVFQALTWVFQIMPLFFFAGVAASIEPWTPGTSWGAGARVGAAARAHHHHRPSVRHRRGVLCIHRRRRRRADQHRRRLLAGRAALALGVVMLTVNIALLLFGPYELSLVGIETQHLKNMTPPSLLLAGHAITMCAFAIAAAPAIARWARRPRVWWLAATGNSGAMTLYLWHIPPLLGIHLVFDYLGYPRHDPSARGFIVLSFVQLLIMAAMVALVFVALRPRENNPLPLWDGGFVAKPGARSAAVGTLLCVAGAATLASVGWGLKDQGVYCVAVMLVALVAARGLANDPQRVCAASLPARTT